MPEKFVLGLPVHRDRPLPPDLKALRALLVAMNGIDVEVTPELVQGLSALVVAWPPIEDTDEP